MHSQTLSKCWLARASNGLESRDEVDLSIGRDIKRQPSQLRRRYMNPLIYGEEVGFGIFIVRQVGL